jgi:hypothetical protein
MSSVRAFLLFALIPLLFGLYTSSVWEDYYITYRASKNLATGHGLVFTEGQRVHTFTSPLGVLLPALCSYVAGPDHDDVALWMFRVICALFLGGAGALLARVLQAQGLSPGLLWAVLLLMAFDIKTVMYSSNGMETAIVIFFLSLQLYAQTANTRHCTWLLGLAWGGVMWSRPDGFIYAGGLAVAVLIFRAGGPADRGWLVRQYLLAGALAAVIYLLWFAWAWSYYGSPVPNTVIAKGLRTHFHLFASLWAGTKDILLLPLRLVHLDPVFAQPYGATHPLPHPGVVWANTLALFAGLPLILPKMSRLTRALAGSYLLSCFYLFHIMPNPYPWYLPSAAWAGYLAMALAWSDGCKYLHWESTWKQMALPGVLVAGQVMIFLFVSYESRIAQQVIEEHNRKPIGLWLRQNAASPKDTVFVECLGYIGFYSQLKMYDYPGLSSPEVIEARRTLDTDQWAPLIEELRPDWLVLRPEEVETLNQQNPAVLGRDYHPVKTFDVTAELIARHPISPRMGQRDKVFTVYHRTEIIPMAH